MIMLPLAREYISRSRKCNSVILLFYMAMSPHMYAYERLHYMNLYTKLLYVLKFEKS